MIYFALRWYNDAVERKQPTEYVRNVCCSVFDTPQKSSRRHGKAGLACVQEEENDQCYQTKSCAVDGKGGQTPILKVFGEKLGAEESRNT